MKIRLLLILAGLAIGFAVPTVAQEQNTVDPEVRQQIEAVLMQYDEAYNKNDAAATAALFTQDAVEVIRTWSAGGLFSGQQAIEKRYGVEFTSSPGNLVSKLLQVYAFGNDILEWSVPPVDTKGHYHVRIYVREADTWKIRMAYIY